jgi:hypothetical protein
MISPPLILIGLTIGDAFATFDVEIPNEKTKLLPHIAFLQ